MPDRIEAVVFDVGNVLYRWERERPYLALIPDPAERAWFLDTVIPLDWHGQHDAGRPAAELVAERSRAYPGYAHLIRHWFDAFNESVPGTVPGSAELVAELGAAGVPLYAITNFGADTWAGFRPTAPLFDLFRDVVVSGIECTAKPDAAIFRLAERRFGRVARSMLFIDDSLTNVEAARALGWHSHHFRNAATLRADLVNRGLLD